jgi:hypothetical protein
MEKPRQFVVHVTLKVIAPNGSDLTPDGEFYVLAQNNLVDAVRLQEKIDRFLTKFKEEPIHGEGTGVSA